MEEKPKYMIIKKRGKYEIIDTPLTPKEVEEMGFSVVKKYLTYDEALKIVNEKE